jgi:RND family efflux transporter MFP subunit
LAICEERLSALLGPYGDREQAEQVINELTLSHVGLEGPRKKSGNHLSQFVLTAPRDGQIVELIATQSSRIAAGEVMLVIADTNDVWVEAQISQRDLPTLDLSTGQVVSVSVPGMDDKNFSATVRFSGSTVSPTTLAVPLVAELDNTDQTFRPGMFVWVSVPTGDSKKTITVPVGAVQQGSNAFVFLNEGGGQFRRVDVEIGIASEGWIEIKSGLKPDDQIVDSGAFFLKSELLLESE